MDLKKELIKLSDTNEIFRKIKLNYWRIKNIPDQIKVEYGARKRKNGASDKRFEQIRKFKNKHLGERCFIIATGPSLTISDIEMLSNEITFGMNSISKIFEQTSWRPTYYGIQDRHVYECLEESILKNFNNNVFIADQIANLFKVPDSFIQFPYNGNYHIYEGDYLNYSTKFSDDAYHIVYDGYSITYSLIQIAIYMGFKEIYLLGCDCNYSKDKKNHFIESGFIDKNASSNAERMLVGYKEAKSYSEKNKIKIYNATRGGMLEVFPRVNLEDII